MKRILLSVVAGLALSLLALSSPAAAASNIRTTKLAAGTSDSAIIAANPAGTATLLEFCGFSARETGGASTATIDVYNGSSASGQLIFTFSLVGAESRSEGPWEDAACIPAPNGIFIDRGGAGTTLLLVYSRQR